MVLSTGQKAWLITNTSKVNVSFDKFKTQRSHMAVYESVNTQPYCTFSNDPSTFSSTMTVGRNVNSLVCVYVCAQDFTTQTNAFLSA
jgi:hypothetical protein